MYLAMLNKTQKKLFLEFAYNLASIDGNYDESERKMIESIEQTFGVRDSFDKDCENLLKEYIGIQSRMNEIVLN